MNWEASLINHKGENRIAVRFERNGLLIDRFKKLAGRQWSKSLNLWHLPDNASYRKQFGLEPKTLGKEALLKIDEVNQPALKLFLDELQLKGYSQNTITTYRNEFAQLLQLLKSNNVNELNVDKLRAYFLYCKNELKLSENTLHSRINAIKFYFEKCLKLEKFFFEIPRPKKQHILPKVFSFEEVQKIIHSTENLKHFIMLSLCYGMGLRVSEIVALKLTDIDVSRCRVLIERAKGKKDRYTNLPVKLIPLLDTYIKETNPKKYLFEGQYGGQYSTRSVQLVFASCKKKAGIEKNIGIHGLRHSFATHSHEMGTDIHLIQKLLGHNDIKTTLIYTHVSNRILEKIESPLDKLLEIKFAKKQ